MARWRHYFYGNYLFGFWTSELYGKYEFDGWNFFDRSSNLRGCKWSRLNYFLRNCFKWLPWSERTSDKSFRSIFRPWSSNRTCLWFISVLWSRICRHFLYLRISLNYFWRISVVLFTKRKAKIHSITSGWWILNISCRWRRIECRSCDLFWIARTSSFLILDSCRLFILPCLRLSRTNFSRSTCWIRIKSNRNRNFLFSVCVNVYAWKLSSIICTYLGRQKIYHDLFIWVIKFGITDSWTIIYF
jgi:hypothetical protein